MREYYINIPAESENSGWVRPSFWPALPTLTAASEAGYILLPVYENRLNRFTVRLTNLAASIDWGDTTSVTSNGAAQTKTYTYATLAGTVYVDAQTGENYKFVTIGITRIGGAITTVDFTTGSLTVPMYAPSSALDYNLSFPNCTSFSLSGNAGEIDARAAKQVRIWALGNLSLFKLASMPNCESLQLPTSLTGTPSYTSFITQLGAVRIGNLNYGNANSLFLAFNTTRILSHGNLIANSATQLLGYCNESYSLQYFGTITANIATDFSQFFYENRALRSVGLITIPLAQDYSNAFYQNRNLVAIRFSNCAACTNTTNMIAFCGSLQVLDMPNLTRGVNFTNSIMGNYGMNIFANGIGTASGGQTITITGTPFGALVTAADATALAIVLVLTTKGYAIAN